MHSQTLISAYDTNLQYTGRYDSSGTDKISFSYPGFSIKATFEGTSITAQLKEYGNGSASGSNYFYVFIDNKLVTKLKLVAATTQYPLASGLTDTIHTIELIKLTESVVGKCDFMGFKIDAGKKLLAPANKPSKRIEFIGDSQTCGYGNEVNYTSTQLASIGGFTSVNENNFYAWGAITARKLDAEYVCTAFSGKGMYMNNDGTITNTIPLVYDQIIPSQALPKWNHSRFTPDVIVINLGTNDFYAEAANIKTLNDTLYVQTYINFIKKLRGLHPNADIVCVVGVMQSDNWPTNKKHWTRIQAAVKGVVDTLNKQNDNNVHYLKLNPQTSPYGEDWHPNQTTHQKGATSIANFINSINGWQVSGIAEHSTETSILINQLSSTQLTCNFTVNATYQINIYTANGQLVHSSNNKYSQGLQAIPLQQTLKPNQAYLIKISGNNQTTELIKIIQ